MSDMASKGKSASELFPGLLPKKADLKPEKIASPGDQPSTSDEKSVVGPPKRSMPVPPPPPDISWLKSGGKLRQKARVTDNPIALVLVKDEQIKSLISAAMQEFDYQVEYSKSAEEIIERTSHATPAIIINHVDSADGSVEESVFHNYMNWLPMLKRRNVVYILIASQVRTLYNLHALTHSANVVVHDKDVPHLAVIIRKGLHDNNILFGPLAEAIQRYAK